VPFKGQQGIGAGGLGEIPDTNAAINATGNNEVFTTPYLVLRQRRTSLLPVALMAAFVSGISPSPPADASLPIRTTRDKVLAVQLEAHHSACVPFKGKQGIFY
jgi:hypothetical protein